MRFFGVNGEAIILVTLPFYEKSTATGGRRSITCCSGMQCDLVELQMEWRQYPSDQARGVVLIKRWWKAMQKISIWCGCTASTLDDTHSTCFKTASAFTRPQGFNEPEVSLTYIETGNCASSCTTLGKNILRTYRVFASMSSEISLNLIKLYFARAGNAMFAKYNEKWTKQVSYRNFAVAFHVLCLQSIWWDGQNMLRLGIPFQQHHTGTDSLPGSESACYHDHICLVNIREEQIYLLRATQ